MCWDAQQKREDCALTSVISKHSIFDEPVLDPGLGAMVDPSLRFGLRGKAANLLGGPVAPGDEGIPSCSVPQFAGFDPGLLGWGLHGGDIVRRPGNIQIPMDLTLAVDQNGWFQWQPPSPVPTAN
jgi:hypothetical protein